MGRRTREAYTISYYIILYHIISYHIISNQTKDSTRSRDSEVNTRSAAQLSAPEKIGSREARVTSEVDHRATWTLMTNKPSPGLGRYAAVMTCAYAHQDGQHDAKLRRHVLAGPATKPKRRASAHNPGSSCVSSPPASSPDSSTSIMIRPSSSTDNK